MASSQVSGSIYTNFQALDRLHAEAEQHKPGAKKAAVQQFESLFVEMMLKSMRQATPQGGLLNSRRIRFFQSMMDHQVALDMARKQGVGLQPILMRQLGLTASAQSSNANAKTKPLIPQARALPLPNARIAAAPQQLSGSSPKSATAQDDWQPASAAAFVRDIWPYAKKAAGQLGVAVKAIIAQAALETGWGQHTMKRPNGASSYNLFGVKAGKHWQGARVHVPTVEYKHGEAVRQRASFRAYDSIADCFQDYVNLIRNHPRYEHAVASGDSVKAYAQALQQAGYSTDPNYAAKIEAIVNSDMLGGSGAALKNSL